MRERGFSISSERARSRSFFLSTLAAAAAISAGDFPIAHLFPLAKRGMSQCQTNAIISETKVFARLSQAIRREPFGRLGSYQSVLSMNGERIIIPLRR